MQALAIYTPMHLFASEPPYLSSKAYRFLAEGDSWFSIGTLNPAKNSNLLFEMAFAQSACAVNCASPGDTLRRMSQMNVDPNFTDLLCGRRRRAWDGLLLSCGGNDLIDALGVAPGAPADKRLLLTAGEWGDESLGPQRYLSEAGWQAFRTYLRANLAHMIGLRDSAASQSKGVPLFVHGYSVPTPRPAGAGGGAGPWLWPAVQTFGIPQADHAGFAQLLIERLGKLFAECAADAENYPNLHFFDSAAITVQRAEPVGGESGDWVNEIHLTWRGYEKIAAPWAASIEAVLRA